MKEVTITVDGKKLTVPAGTLLIEACEANGIYIPRFCYHKHLFPSGNCRMCLVKIEKNPKPQPACMTPVSDGMEVHTETPEVAEIRKAILEFVLINHPLDCPICDKAGECMLQDQYMEFSGEKSRFNETKVAKEKLYDFGRKIIYDAERCITCSRCVRITREVSKTNKLGIFERGDRSYVALAHGDTLDDDPYAYCVVDNCPVGALTAKYFRFKERVWYLHNTPSICAGCSRGCNIWVDTKDNKIYRVRPRENDEVNKSWMCDFGREYYVFPQKNRAAGVKINHRSADYERFVGEVADLLKNNASKTAFVLSAYATNEELKLARQLIDHLGIKGVFHKKDRIWKEGSGEVYEDDVLIKADKTPNMTGLKKEFPEAKDIETMVISDYSHAFVWGPGAPMEKLDGLELIVVSPMADQVWEKAKHSLAGRISVEKHGSYTNFEGKVQTFRRAIKGENNFDELTFFVDLLKNLGVQPLGRTVDEVRQAN